MDLLRSKNQKKVHFLQQHSSYNNKANQKPNI